ncbi:unnamed protein product [Mucor hiemalis]
MNNQSFSSQNTLYTEQLYAMGAENTIDNDHYLQDFGTAINNHTHYRLLEDQESAYGAAVKNNYNNNLLSHSSKELLPTEVLRNLLQEQVQEQGQRRAINSPRNQKYTSMLSIQGSRSSTVSPYISGYDSDASSFSGMMPFERGHVPPLVDSFSQRQQLQVSQEFLQLQHQIYIQNPLLQNRESFFSGNVMVGADPSLYTSPYNTFNINPFQENVSEGLTAEMFYNPISIPNTTHGTILNTPVTNGNRNTQSSKKDAKVSTVKTKKSSNLQCTICDKKFSRPYNLKSHQKTHTKERPYACSYPNCRWNFARPHDLKRHILCLHQNIKPYGCTCGKRFARSDAFRRHQTVNVACNPNKEDQNPM